MVRGGGWACHLHVRLGVTAVSKTQAPRGPANPSSGLQTHQPRILLSLPSLEKKKINILIDPIATKELFLTTQEEGAVDALREKPNELNLSPQGT